MRNPLKIILIIVLAVEGIILAATGLNSCRRSPAPAVNLPTSPKTAKISDTGTVVKSPLMKSVAPALKPDTAKSVALQPPPAMKPVEKNIAPVQPKAPLPSLPMTKTVPPQTLPAVKPAARSVATVQPKAPLPSLPMTKTVPPQTLPAVKPVARSVATVQPKAPLPSQPMTKTVPPQTLPAVKPVARSVATVQPKAPLPSQPMTKTVPPQTLPAVKPVARSSAPAAILPVSKPAGQPVKTFRRPAVPEVFKNAPPELKLGIYTISIGAFPTEAEAIRFKQPYVRKGYVAINWNVTVDGKALYRVVVGRFNTSRDAQRAIKAAKHDLPKDSWVVPIESDYTHF